MVVAWCLKLLLDELSRGDDTALTTVAAATAGLAGAGLLMSMRQSVDAYLSSMVRRAVQLAVQDRLLKRVNGYVGLQRSATTCSASTPTRTP